MSVPDRQIETIRRAASRFTTSAQGTDAFTDDLARDYHLLRTTLAFSFRDLALAALPAPTPSYADLRQTVQAEMRRLFEGRVDSSLLRVTGYTSPHPQLYALLMANVGQAVPAWRLRILTNDAVHTERRTRELRDLGLTIETWVEDEEAHYRLTSRTPDSVYAAAYQLRERAGKLKSSGQKRAIIELAESTATLPPRRASAGD